MKKAIILTLILCQLSLFGQVEISDAKMDTLVAAMSYTAAVNHYKKENYDSAIVEYSKVLLVFPELSDIYYDRGFVRYLNEDYIGAIDDLSNCLKYDPEDKDGLNGDSYLFRGMAKMITGNKMSACEDFELAKSKGMKEAEELLERQCNDEKSSRQKGFN